MECISKIIKDSDTKLSFFSGFIASKIKPDKKYRIEVKELKSSRSLNQNSFFWKIVLDCLNDDNSSFSDKESIYLYLLKKAHIESEIVVIDDSKVDEYKRIGLYRVIEILDRFEFVPDGTNKKMLFDRCACYKGSSHFDTKEMSKLIDTAIDFANEQGIENDYLTEWRKLK